MRILLLLSLVGLLAAQPRHGVRPQRLVIRGATVVEGNGTPAAGPLDIVVENGVISAIGRAPRQPNDVEIDARGKYVLPGLINMHGHLHNERGGVPMDPNYVLKLWLACGVTTVRDVGSPLTQTLAFRARSEAGELAAPRLFVYPMLGRVRDPETARRRVQEIKKAGADGMKIVGAWRDTMDAALDEAHKLGLPVAQHIGVEETRATDAIQPVPPERIATAIEACQADNLLQSRKGLKRRIRSATVGDWRNHLTEEHLAIFRDVHAGRIRALGYAVQ